MARTRRAQFSMAPDEYQQLVNIAQRERISVAELIRTDVRERYLTRSLSQSIPIPLRVI